MPDLLKGLLRSLHYYVLWLVALSSLALNVFTIYSLIQARRQASEALASAAAAIEGFKDGSFDYTVKIDHEIPVAAEVPVKFTVQVPISNTIPINTIVSVPLRTFLGTFPISVPVSTKVPISITVEVPIDQVVDFKTVVPVNFDVPISIKIANTPLGKGLNDVQQILEAYAKKMGGAADDPKPK